MKVVEQYPINFFFECGAVSFDFVEQYLLISWSSIPNQFQKGLGYAVVKTVGFSGNCTRVAQGLHKGCTRTAQGPHSACFFPTFFAFQARETKFGRTGSFQIFSGTWSFQILCDTRSFQNLCGTWSIQILCGTRSYQIFCGTRSFQILGGTRSFQILCGYGYSRKKTFDIILKLHEPGSMAIAQN